MRRLCEERIVGSQGRLLLSHLEPCISQTDEKAQRTGNRILTPDLSTRWHQGSQACWVSKDPAHHYKLVGAVQSLSHVWLFANPWTAARQDSLSFTVSWSLLKLMSIELVMPSISSSVVPFSSCPQSFPASGSFQMSQLFTSGGQSIGVSAGVLPMNIQDWFPLGLTGLISLQSKGLSRVFCNTTVQRTDSSVFSLLYGPIPTSIQDYWKTIALTRWTFVSKVMSVLF